MGVRVSRIFVCIDRRHGLGGHLQCSAGQRIRVEAHSDEFPQERREMRENVLKTLRGALHGRGVVVSCRSPGSPVISQVIAEFRYDGVGAVVALAAQ